MRYHWSVKLTAFLLATVFLIIAAASGLGIGFLANENLYTRSVDDAYDRVIRNEVHHFSVNLAHRYASLELGGIPQMYLDYYYGDYWLYDEFKEGTWFYTISDSSGKILESTLPEDPGTYVITDSNGGVAVSGSPAPVKDLLRLRPYKNEVTDLGYRQLISSKVEVPEIAEETDPSTTAPALAMEEAAEDCDSASEYAATEITEPTVCHNADNGIYYDGYWDTDRGAYVNVQYRQGILKHCIVTLYLTEGAIQEEGYWTFLRQIVPYRFALLWSLGISFVLFLLCGVYLCAAAGRAPGSEEIRAGKLNRLPLDLYGGGALLGVIGLCILFIEGFEHLLRQSSPLAVPAGLAMITGMAILANGFFFALVAQFKTKGGYWWRNALVGRFMGFCGRWVFRGLKAARNMLPIVARWLGIMALEAIGAVFFLVCTSSAWHDFWTFLWAMCFLGFCLLILATICYGAWCFGCLLKGARNMAQGDLDQKIENKYLYGSFCQMARELNNLADGAKIAAERQMKSERMKTELITNVSHDIKTPLTSIINYVDLLKSAKTDEEQAQYLEVLDRQSQALKKLIEDLMDMSKASSGNVTVELTRIDVAEAINQALGEFADKLDAVSLTPVFRHPEEVITISADGKHLWRILHNLLSNACKYAMPGTRLYLDLLALEGRAVLTIKNISKEELNMDAEALMERFVRGDASRNTEGNGLGLNIAQSLAQLQKGDMNILVDGDLFKVTLSFPLI